jgi:hypothetical protein
MKIDTQNGVSNDIMYHMNCFKCLMCDKMLEKGEKYILRNEGIYCKSDFERNNLLTNNQLMHNSNENSLGANGSKTPNYQNGISEYGLPFPNAALGANSLINNQNSSFSSSPVSSSSSVSSISSMSASIYSNPGSHLMHQQQMDALPGQAQHHSLLLQNSSANNLFSPINQNQFNKQIGLSNKLSINPNLLNTTSLTANNTNSNSSFASFQSRFFEFFFLKFFDRFKHEKKCFSQIILKSSK